MSHSSKRRKTKDSSSLIDLERVESLDMLLGEIKQDEQIWIENFDVFVTTDNTASHEDYIHLNCDVDSNTDSSVLLTFYSKTLLSLTSTVEEVLSLPDLRQQRNIGFLGSMGETYEDLIFTPEQLEKIFSARETRTYSFWYLNLSPEQSVVLAAKTKLEAIWFCSIRDKGLALIDWLEHHNEGRTLGSFSCQFYNAWENILEFLCRSMYPVFDQIVLDQFHRYSNMSLTYELLVSANVGSILELINPYSFVGDDCKILIQSLENGTLRCPKLELCFDAESSELDQKLDFFEVGFKRYAHAMSSPKCTLKELHLQMETVRLSDSAVVFESYLVAMLHENQSLSTLGIDSLVEPLGFPAMGILNAATEHPKLRTLKFISPATLDPPNPESSEPFQVWVRENLYHSVRFHNSHFDTKYNKDQWQDCIFFSRCSLLHNVPDERIRSYLLVALLANQQHSVHRVRFLLSWNRDVFTK
ncbi:hypothetical protein FisN_2Hu433 [Fistulifera solaris]|uniref:Uncharacterized protein n=1 Tax=Fistulifera solaris TaxID=1519565 RepID=A0A1Z5KJY7_FISSO|nr:hypothetical protein FisN_2Hu433 [Fistulifera solaris]|eukprot:GAX26634.1 hypothetical protein FisN_2Hu433 [Fistulifera solaris]